MGNVSNKIRNHIGEGELLEAIETMNNYLKRIGGDLYNQAIHLKGRYKEYARNRDLGMGNNLEEKSKISMAVLNLASEIENGDFDKPPTRSEFEQQRPTTSHFTKPFQAPVSQPQNTNQWVAQCQFTMDTMHYFLNQAGQIFMVNPFNNQSTLVGLKMPPQNPQFAWTLYFTTTNIYYLVDHAGIIWGQNFGMPAQFGTVRYF